MTPAQQDITRYLRGQFEGVKLEPIREAIVRMTDKGGTTKDYTANIYGDIMDAETKEIVAISDLPHTLDALPITARPTSWENKASR